MKYFPLLIIFPAEIVNIILKFVVKNESSEKISHYLKIHYLKKEVLKKSISYILNEEICINNNNKSIISNLNFILINYYSKKYYNKIFWNHYLNVLSSKIMQQYNNIHLYNKYSKEDRKKNIIYLKKIIYYWFELCKKHNIKLQICYINNNISNKKQTWLYEYARNIKQIKNFHNLASCPKTLYITNIETNDYWYDYDETYEINSSLATMKNYLLYNILTF
tara:strand:- start:59 stop:721 length:663 start_codon:yes stop_codon:yes gene_type:complete